MRRDWLSIAEVCDVLGLSRPSVQSLIDRGELQAKNVSASRKRRKYPVHRDWLEEFKSPTQVQPPRSRRAAPSHPLLESLRVREFSG